MRTWLFLCLLLGARVTAGADQAPCTPFDFAHQVAVRKFWNSEGRKDSATPVLLPGLYDSPLRLQRLMTRRTMTSFMAFSATPSVLRVDPPFDAAGKLFVAMKNGTQGDFCTASFIDVDMVMTAAHCVCPSSCFDQFLFTRVFGTGGDQDFDINAWTVPDEWLKLGEPDRFLFDVAFLSTASNLQQAAPIAIDPAIAATCIAVGYPVANNLGAMLDSAEGPAAFDQASGMILMDDNTLGAGSSGGPWTPAVNHVSTGTLFSVASRFGPSDTSLLGPVLDLSVIQPLLQRARKRCR